MIDLTDKQIAKLTQSQRVWWEEAGSAMLEYGKVDNGPDHPLHSKIMETFNGKEIDK